mgnify:CR=1 FL=1
MFDNKIPSEPHGTLDELKKFDLDPSQYGSCSQRTPTNLGCPYYRSCRFHKWKNQEEGHQGPLNVCVQIKLRQQEGGHADNREMPCFMYYQSGLAARQGRQEATGEHVAIISVEGDGTKFKYRGSRSVGKSRDDVRMEAFVAEKAVTPFQRLGEVSEAESFNAEIASAILEGVRSAPVVDRPADASTIKKAKKDA